MFHVLQYIVHSQDGLFSKQPTEHKKKTIINEIPVEDRIPYVAKLRPYL